MLIDWVPRKKSREKIKVMVIVNTLGETHRFQIGSNLLLTPSSI